MNPDVIEITQSPDEVTRTRMRGCRWVAAATMPDGQTLSAASRTGAPQALARALVAAGTPDAPVRVFSAGLRGYTAYRSLHAMAVWVYREAETKPVHRARFAVRPNFEVLASGATGVAERVISVKNALYGGEERGIAEGDIPPARWA